MNGRRYIGKQPSSLYTDATYRSPGNYAQFVCLFAIAARRLQVNGTSQATLFHQLGMTKADFTKLVTSRRSNGLLQLRVPTIKNKLHFFRDEIGLSNEEVRKLLVKCPRILEHKLESNMRPHLGFLRSHGISKEDISKVLSAACSCRLSPSTFSCILCLVVCIDLRLPLHRVRFLPALA